MSIRITIPQAMTCLVSGGGLFMFYVGVETGQLLFITAVLSLFALLKRLPLQAPQGSWCVLSYSIGSVAAFWTIQRVGLFI